MDEDNIETIWPKLAAMARSDLYSSHTCLGECTCSEDLEREISVISEALGVKA